MIQDTLVQRRRHAGRQRSTRRAASAEVRGRPIWRAPDQLVTDPAVPTISDLDLFGSRCSRLVAPQGRFVLCSNAVVSDSGAPDIVAPTAVQTAVEALRDDATVAERPNSPDSPPTDGPARSAPPPARSPNSDQRIHVEFDGQDYQPVVSVAPDQSAHMYVRPLKRGPRRLAPAAGLKLLGFVGG